MSYATRTQASIGRITRHFGERATLTIRRHHTLADPVQGVSLQTLQVSGTFPSGSSSIDLTATDLSGKIVPGITLTIAGDSTTYTVQNEVEASSDVLSGVQISPTLSQQAADGASVTLSDSKTYGDIPAAVTSIDLDRVDRSLIQDGDRQIIVSSVNAPVTSIDQEDTLLLDGNVLSIRTIVPHRANGTTAGWRIIAGGVG